MGANAQTSVWTFTAGSVLTAAQMNDTARTGVPVFASTATRDAAFGGTGEKTLAEGQMCYVESTGFQTYNGTSWVTWGTAPASGLTLISSTTIGSAVTSVAVSNCFSNTYDNYKIIVSGGAMSANGYIKLFLGTSTADYYYTRQGMSYSGASVYNNGYTAASTFEFIGYGTSTGLNMSVELQGPNLAKNTIANAFCTSNATGEGAEHTIGYINNTTQYTGFTIERRTAGQTMTGGTIKVYGYQN